MPKKAENGKLTERFTVRLSQKNMSKLHAYSTRQALRTGEQVSYSRAIAMLIEGLPKSQTHSS
jgi:hypothetical protein